MRKYEGLTRRTIPWPILWILLIGTAQKGIPGSSCSASHKYFGQKVKSATPIVNSTRGLATDRPTDRPTDWTASNYCGCLRTLEGWRICQKYGAEQRASIVLQSIHIAAVQGRWLRLFLFCFVLSAGGRHREKQHIFTLCSSGAVQTRTANISEQADTHMTHAVNSAFIRSTVHAGNPVFIRSTRYIWSAYWYIILDYFCTDSRYPTAHVRT